MRTIDADELIDMMRKQAGCYSCDNYNEILCRACPWHDAINVVDDFAYNHPAVPAVR